MAVESKPPVFEAENEREESPYSVEAQEIEKQLYKDLAALDRGELEYIGDENGVVVYQGEQGQLLAHDDSGLVERISLGEVLTAQEWGISLKIMPERTNRFICRQFLIERAINQLHRLHNLELIEEVRRQVREREERGTANEHDLIRLDVYLTKEKEIKEGSYTSGIIAEKLVRILLKKIAHDFNLDFQIYEADVRQDIEDKIDFVITRSQGGGRGVEVDGSDQLTFGVQFTTSRRPELLIHKQEQIARIRKEKGRQLPVDDFLLISIPLPDIEQLINRYQSNPTFHGPDSLWDTKTKEKIIRQCLNKIYSPDEIDSICHSALGRG